MPCGSCPDIPEVQGWVWVRHINLPGKMDNNPVKLADSSASLGNHHWAQTVDNEPYWQPCRILASALGQPRRLPLVGNSSTSAQLQFSGTGLSVHPHHCFSLASPHWSVACPQPCLLEAPPRMADPLSSLLAPWRINIPLTSGTSLSMWKSRGDREVDWTNTVLMHPTQSRDGIAFWDALAGLD